MTDIRIPDSPASVALPIVTQWDGSPAPLGVRASVYLSSTDEGLLVRALALHQTPARIPPRPAGRCDGLWEHDVVEVFLAGEDGTYVEIELGAGGHWLVFGFSAVRERSDEYADLVLDVTHLSSADGWDATVTIPWDIIPTAITRMNAFAILGGHHLAYHPVPGTTPDFHQPAHFPRASLERAR